jgi:hypothetical protein
LVIVIARQKFFQIQVNSKRKILFLTVEINYPYPLQLSLFEVKIKDDYFLKTAKVCYLLQYALFPNDLERIVPILQHDLFISPSRFEEVKAK